MSWDDDLRKGLDQAADLLPIDQTDALAAAKSVGRTSVRRRRVLAASGGVLTASALLVGALSLAQDPPSESVVAGDPVPPVSACDGAFPTAEGLDATRFEAVDDRTWTVDGHTLVITDAHRLNRANARVGEARFEWITVGDTEREVERTLFAGASATELGFRGIHLPAGCDGVVIRLDADVDQGGRLVLEEFEDKLVWPASPEPEPVLVSDPVPICGPVAPFRSAELDSELGPPTTAVDPDGRLTMRWADARSVVEIHHPAGPAATDTLSAVRSYGTDPACELAELTAAGVVSAGEARSVLRAVDADLVDVDTRLGTGVETSSAFQVAEPTTTTLPPTVPDATSTTAPPDEVTAAD